MPSILARPQQRIQSGLTRCASFVNLQIRHHPNPARKLTTVAFSYLAALMTGVIALAGGAATVAQVASRAIEAAHVQNATKDLQNVVGQIVLQQALTGRYATDPAFLEEVVAGVQVSPGTVVTVEAGAARTYTLTATNPGIKHHTLTYAVGSGPNSVVVGDKE